MNTNNVQSYYHESNSHDTLNLKPDRLFVIDSRLTLYKLSVEREVKVLKKVPLTRFKNIHLAVETMLLGTDFARICITERVLTLYGKCYNLQTGYEWDYSLNCEDAETENKTKVLLTENLPFSNL